MMGRLVWKSQPPHVSIIQMLSLVAKKKMMKVLTVANGGVLSDQEIVEKSGFSDSVTIAALNTLERGGYVVSGMLHPSEVRIYRVTRLGVEKLAGATTRHEVGDVN